MGNEIQHGVTVYPHVTGQPLASVSSEPVTYTATSKDWQQQPVHVETVDDETARQVMDKIMVQYDEAWTKLAQYDAGVWQRQEPAAEPLPLLEVPAAQVAIHADAIPADVAAALLAHHSAEWCVRLIDELLDLMEAAKDAERHERIAAAILAKAGALE